MGRTLSEKDASHAQEYETNAVAYRETILKLSQEVASQIDTIPASSRVLVTAHDAFGYFGKAFGMNVYGLQGISTVDEADLGTINEIIDLLIVPRSQTKNP